MGSLSDMEGNTPDLSRMTTVEQRFAMMWQLSQDAYATNSKSAPESSPRYVARLIRLGG
jgi:hypothetical protein